jgi:threonine/homoserine/homoserine lactone efflux protein
LTVLKALCLGWGVGFVAAIPAGPVGAAVFAQGIEGGRRRTPAFILGAILVDGIYCALAFLGVSYALKPWLASPIMGAVAMAFLLVVGYRMAVSQPVFEGGASDGILERLQESHHGAFITGFLMSASNPALLVTWTAIVVVLQNKELVGDGVVMLVAFATTAALGMGCWLLMLHRLAVFGRAFLTPARVKWVVRILGLIVMATGVYYGAWTMVRWVAAH